MVLERGQSHEKLGQYFRTTRCIFYNAGKNVAYCGLRHEDVKKATGSRQKIVSYGVKSYKSHEICLYESVYNLSV